MEILLSLFETTKEFIMYPSKRQAILIAFSKESIRHFYSTTIIMICALDPKNILIKWVVGIIAFIYLTLSWCFKDRFIEALALKLSLSRNISRVTGWVSRVKVPRILRNRLFGMFADSYCVIRADMIEPLDAYDSFNAFFTRRVHPRQIDTDTDILVCPADSRVLSITEVTSDQTILVKGITYRISEFLTGESKANTHKEATAAATETEQETQQQQESGKTHEFIDSLKLASHKTSKIFQAIFYLNPGDYHRYHSPASYLVKKSNHILGYLAPVKESYIATHERVYEGNERVALFGEWKHGSLTQVYVGATNVGSMTLEFDPELRTNQSIGLNFEGFHKSKETIYGEQNKKSDDSTASVIRIATSQIEDKNTAADVMPSNDCAFEEKPTGIFVKKGSEIGRFNLGSTVVMFFEAPDDNIDWFVNEGDKVRFGQPLCKIMSTPEL